MTVLAATWLTVGVLVTGCTTEPLEEVKPHNAAFSFAGDTLDVRQHGIPTDLVVGVRDDVLVSYRVSAAGGKPRDPELSLAGGVLQLGDPCPPLVFCDARYRVEIPEGITVLRDGEPTDIKGK